MVRGEGGHSRPPTLSCSSPLLWAFLNLWLREVLYSPSGVSIMGKFLGKGRECSLGGGSKVASLEERGLGVSESVGSILWECMGDTLVLAWDRECCLGEGSRVANLKEMGFGGSESVEGILGECRVGALVWGRGGSLRGDSLGEGYLGESSLRERVLGESCLKERGLGGSGGSSRDSRLGEYSGVSLGGGCLGESSLVERVLGEGRGGSLGEGFLVGSLGGRVSRDSREGESGESSLWVSSLGESSLGEGSPGVCREGTLRESILWESSSILEESSSLGLYHRDVGISFAQIYFIFS